MNQLFVKIFVSVAIRDGDRLLLVQEGKQDSLGLWNLPGGHLALIAVLIVSFLTGVRPSVQGAELRVGVGAVVITPPAGTPLSGYYEPRGSTGVLDDIYSDDIAKANDVARRLSEPGTAFMEKVKAFQVLDVAAREGRPLEVEIQAITLGDQIAWVSLPGEVFVELGLAIKKASPFKYTMIVELANGSIGYIPNKPAYAEGNYEVVSARCAEGAGELMVATAIKLLNELSSKGGTK